MGDIEKIRLWVEGKYDPDPSGDEEWLALCVRLADEIERLQAEVEMLCQFRDAVAGAVAIWGMTGADEGSDQDA